MKMDIKYMKMALDLAKRGKGMVNPNPMVGAVVVKDGKIVGKGYHKFYGGPHAEVYALEEVGEKGVDGTIYVTLEPCSHYGKTPPCVKKIIETKIKRCVIATLDPNPLVSGRGKKILEEAGIEVVVGVLKEEALKQNKVFFKYIKEKEPFLYLKCAITLDGKIATRNKDSKWISNELSRERVQQLRHEFMGIMVGINTLLSDDPRLTARVEGGRDPFRIIVDPNFKTPELYKVVQKNQDKKTIIVTSSEVKEERKGEVKLYMETYNIQFIFLDGKRYKVDHILKEVGKLGIDSVLLEGGGSLISQSFEEDRLDGGTIFIAPKILGDSNGISFYSGRSVEKMEDALELKNPTYKIYGDNIAIEF